MKNIEKYKDEILAQLCKSGNFALDKHTKKLCDCYDCQCSDCLFSFYSMESCSDGRATWLNSEHKEPKVFTEEEKALIRLLSKIEWVARDKNGELFAYAKKPEKGNNAWCFGDDDYFYFDLSASTNCKFLSVKWEDAEPISRDEILKSH